MWLNIQSHSQIKNAFNKIETMIKKIINSILNKFRKIDYVFPYVNASDEKWREEHDKIIGKPLDIARYRDPGTLELYIQLLYKNMPWLNKIFIILADKSNIPEFLKKYKKVKVVRHSEFIPSMFLPTYNSGTIESFLHRIPKLSEYFIYGNDDVYTIKPLNPDDFFDFQTGQIKLTVKMKKYDPIRRSCDSLRKSCATKLLKQPDVKFVPVQTHILSPYRKSLYQQAFNEYEDVILNSCTRTRVNSQNICQYFFGYWLYLHNMLMPSSIKGVSKVISQRFTKVKDLFDNQVVCINDSKLVSGDNYKKLWSIFKIKLIASLKK